MPFKLWNVGEEVIAPDFNPIVGQQVIAQFPNAAARTAAITAPVTGMVSHLADSPTLLWIYYAGAWHTYAAGGVLAYLEQTASQAGITNATVDLTGLVTPTLTIPAGRRIRISAEIMFNPGTVASPGVLILADGGNTQITQQNVYMATPSQSYSVYATRIITPAAGTYTYKARGQAGAGLSISSTTSGTFPGVLIVEDVGAAVP